MTAIVAIDGGQKMTYYHQTASAHHIKVTGAETSTEVLPNDDQFRLLSELRN